MPVEWLERNGKRILMIDHRNLESDALIKNLERAEEIVMALPPTVRVLRLSNYEGAIVDMRVMEHMKSQGSDMEARTEKAALIGVDGIRHILVDAYNRVTGAGEHQKLFDNQEEALDWLTS